ncbi:MAG: HIT domain-containing protein [Thermomicrobiales bacterium]|nr:HIT domain-containing protein [Thermomicrobiales bacterium]
MSEDAVPPGTARLGRIWTPWRMQYVTGGPREEGCVFCNRLREQQDTAALIAHRGETAYVILNLFPYNTGHVMLVPKAHVSSPEEADDATTHELADLRRPVMRAVRRALNPVGFNIGVNVGAVAGAGIAAHLHEHIVPRWPGDANFMPVIASTQVLPEVLPVTYAKIRAELQREVAGESDVHVVLLDPGGEATLLADGAFPTVSPGPEEPVWAAALRLAQQLGVRDPVLLGWAGGQLAGQGPVVLALGGVLPAQQAVGSAAAVELLAPEDAQFLASAIALAPARDAASTE